MAYRKRCVVCGTERNVQGHHVVSRNALKREFPKGAVMLDAYAPGEEMLDTGRIWWPAPRGFVACEEERPHRSLRELLWDPRNGVPVCERDHARHEVAFRRVPVERLHAAVFEYARELGLQHRLEERFYPRDTSSSRHRP